jgi:GNAT superfamily N-acetyltransferase
VLFPRSSLGCDCGSNRSDWWAMFHRQSWNKRSVGNSRQTTADPSGTTKASSTRSRTCSAEAELLISKRGPRGCPLGRLREWCSNGALDELQRRGGRENRGESVGRFAEHRGHRVLVAAHHRERGVAEQVHGHAIRHAHRYQERGGSVAQAVGGVNIGGRLARASRRLNWYSQRREFRKPPSSLGNTRSRSCQVGAKL